MTTVRATEWGTIIPLIGGCSIGTAEALGTKPRFLASYPGFHGNDRHILNHWSDVPYVPLDDETNLPIDAIPDGLFEGIEFINTVCPCAGLSALTSNDACKTGAERVDNPQNEWMFHTAEHVLGTLKPRVFWGENAPALFTNGGKAVADRLYEIGQKNGYSFSLYKTSTIKHGLPQARLRTFYFFWDSKTAPVMPWFERPRKTFEAFIGDFDNTDVTHTQERPVGARLEDSGYYKWIFDKYGSEWRSKMKGVSGTIVMYAKAAGLLEDMEAYFDKNDMGEIKTVRRAIRKFADGKNIWDPSPHVFQQHDYIGGIQGRTFAHAVHPHEDRYLNIREFMRLMGLPEDFDLIDEKGNNAICQNVPTNTAGDMARAVVMYLDGELPTSTTTFLKQNNLKGVNEHRVEQAPSLIDLLGD